ncbi:MAG TPA: Gfo/Idh/MocA family oxidoreductase, partial [Planctomycetaceae bacterium]|nr:Gfo/Idh/MocA family oxidoreductase [Planctomycetaceae bacterium]
MSGESVGRRGTRRDFLASLAGSSAAPFIVRASALGSGGRPAPGDRITVGYIGTGPRGMVNIRELLSCPAAQVVAVCDVWEQRRRAAKQFVDRHYGSNDCKAYRDFRELLARPDIDAVGIASTDHWHVPQAIMAAKAGKDVCVEKPLGVSVAEDLACRDTVRRYERVFQYGTEARAMPACRLGAELVRNGRIGRVQHIRLKAPNSVRGDRRQVRPVPKGLDYQLWLGPAPWRPYRGCAESGSSWFHVYDYSLGFIAGWGAHPLDLLQWAWPLERAGLWEIEGTGTIHYGETHDVVMDWDVRIRFGSGVTMEFWAAGVKKKEHPQLARRGNYAQIIGTDGWVALYYGGMSCEPERLKLEKFGPDELRLPVSSGQERNFIESVRTRSEPVSNINDAVQSDLVSQLADIAIRTGCRIRWDP